MYLQKFDNKIMLTTYADSLGKDLKELKKVLNKYIGDAIGGLYILPFYPSSGDGGFAPTTYMEVDPKFGDWDDINDLAQDYYLMFYFLINHISVQSEYYKDFLKHKDDSKYKDMFIRYKDFWEGGYPSEEEEELIYTRKPAPPYIEAEFADGSSEKIWCTFIDEHADINNKSEEGRIFIRKNLRNLAKYGASLIQLGSFGYATKKAGTNCFFIEPDVWELLGGCIESLDPYSVIVVPEIHEHYTYQIKLAEKGYFVFDFALSILILNALYFGHGKYLKYWLEICPKRQFTVLDTHDGIGVSIAHDLMPYDEIRRTEETLLKSGVNIKKEHSTYEYNNVDIYQTNTTYYSALGERDDAYLLARVLQFFTPGIPVVYYNGMLAGKNDIDLVEKTKIGRNVNRPSYKMEEVREEIKRPIVGNLLKFMKFRNNHSAFNLDGDCKVELEGEGTIIIRRTYKDSYAILKANLKTFEFDIDHS